MKQWQELKQLSLSGKHITLRGLTQSGLEDFCAEQSNNKKLQYLTLSGNVRGYKITDFSCLSRLPALKELYLEDAITQAGLEQVCRLTNLTELHIEHGGKLTSLRPLSKLTKLKGLTVSTPTGWITKLLHLPSLAPLENMVDLQYLYLAGVAFDEGRLEPVKKLHKLKKIIVISRYWDDALGLKDYCPDLDVNQYVSLIEQFRKRSAKE